MPSRSGSKQACELHQREVVAPISNHPVWAASHPPPPRRTKSSAPETDPLLRHRNDPQRSRFASDHSPRTKRFFYHPLPPGFSSLNAIQISSGSQKKCFAGDGGRSHEPTGEVVRRQRLKASSRLQ